MKCKEHFSTNCVSLASFFSRSFTASSMVNLTSLLDSILEVFQKLRPFARRSILIWVNFMEDILITHFFLSDLLVTFFVTLFLLINPSNFRICLFFVKSKDFLYEFWWIFSTKWNSSDIIDSKILPFNCLMLFLSLSRITWLICIRSCNNSLPASRKIVLLRSVLILLFSCKTLVESCCNDNEEKRFRILARMASP